ncbi:hypothetical protein V6N13_140547 [Hibiscus sabdariffa]|uniref:Uncharacterized protein n=2 Tax=Hibiscus sabdariffa TaxID=183260 RepID=A0ABR2Q2K2_9ROSI
MEGSSLSVRKGAWTEKEDILLKNCIEKYGEGKWHKVPSRAGLNRCRKSCRLRWTNYLNPNIKRGAFAADEVDLIIRLHNLLGNRWSLIAGRLPGRTANDVKNYFNTHLSKKKVAPSFDPKPHLNPSTPSFKVIKPCPLILSKNSFPVILCEDKKTNTTTATTLASNNILVSANGGNNIGYCFPNENDEVIWWDNLMMNGKETDYQQKQDSMNNINLSVLGDWHINEEMDCSTTCNLDEEDNYGNLDELYLDGELWNVFNQ